MAKSSTRRVSIYINSEEVEATVKQIHFEMNKLVNEQNRMIIGCSPYLSCRRFAACTPFLRGTRLPRRDIAWRAAQSPHCARYARLCGVIERMSLRDISQARVCRAARIRMDAHFYRAFVPVGTRGVRRQHFYQAFAPVGAFMCDGAQFLQICNA